MQVIPAQKYKEMQILKNYDNDNDIGKCKIM